MTFSNISTHDVRLFTPEEAASMRVGKWWRVKPEWFVNRLSPALTCFICGHMLCQHWFHHGACIVMDCPVHNFYPFDDFREGEIA